MTKLYDSDGREYTPSIPPAEVPSTTGLNEPAVTESTESASEPAQPKE